MKRYVSEHSLESARWNKITVRNLCLDME